MNRIDPNNVVVLVRNSSDSIVRVGVSSWRELREVVRAGHPDDTKRATEIDAEVGRVLSSGVVSS